MREEKIDFGKQAEKAAAEFLKKSGYKILQCNYKTKLGEIDIIAEDKGVICFVEVKARHSLDFGGPEEAVSARKRRQISKSAIIYLKAKDLLDRLSRFDVVALLYTDDLPKVTLIKDAFELAPGFSF